MAHIEINRTTWTKLADAADVAFCVTSRDFDGFEVLFGSDRPAPDAQGALVPPGFANGVNRLHGTGHAWGKVPARSRNETSLVITTAADPPSQ
ncbi:MULTISPECIES: hypothetical protein [unclassified Thiocapsa]|uniref:hypothetical protein n=1 Tax=unclassified Thiocapsa TaxID=2641286 RepID=UPI0035AD8A18